MAILGWTDKHQFGERMDQVLSPAHPIQRPRWYQPSPGRLFVGVLFVEGILFLTERWFPKGWPVLIAIAGVGVTMVAVGTTTVAVGIATGVARAEHPIKNNASQGNNRFMSSIIAARVTRL